MPVINCVCSLAVSLVFSSGQADKMADVTLPGGKLLGCSLTHWDTR